MFIHMEDFDPFCPMFIAIIMIDSSVKVNISWGLKFRVHMALKGAVKS